MSSPKLLAFPSHLSAAALWLLTILFGSGLTSTAATRFFLHAFDINAIIRAGMLCTMAAIVFSAPALCILPFGIRWALGASVASHRITRLLTLLSGLFGLAALLSIIFITDSTLIKSGVLWFASCYWLAALAATYWLYGSWIFPKHSQG